MLEAQLAYPRSRGLLPVIPQTVPVDAPMDGDRVCAVQMLNRQTGEEVTV